MFLRWLEKHYAARHLRPTNLRSSRWRLERQLLSLRRTPAPPKAVPQPVRVR